MTMNAKQLIEQRLRSGVSAVPSPGPLIGRADPTLLNGASEALTTITRPDRSTLGPNGNRAHDLEAIATRKRLDYAQRSASSPLGASLPGGFYI